MAKADLSVLTDALSGKAGGVVFAKTRVGTVVKPRRGPKNPRTGAQRLVRDAFSRASRGYKNLTPEQAELWRAYAVDQSRRQPVTGEVYAPTAVSVYVELVSRLLQVNPTAEPLSTPPISDYPGDTIVLTATARTGAVVFETNSANRSDTVTELLLQRLASRNRVPLAGGYRVEAAVQFTSGSPTASLSVIPGLYAAAYRFVNRLTGQATNVVELPIVEVTLAVARGGKKAA